MKIALLLHLIKILSLNFLAGARIIFVIQPHKKNLALAYDLQAPEKISFDRGL